MSLWAVHLKNLEFLRLVTLARLSSTVAPKTRRHQKLSTLNSNLIQDTDFVDFSHKTRTNIRFFASGKGVGDVIQYHYRNGYMPFPSGTRGFLYWKSEEEISSLAGALRFRITGSADPKSFEDGCDLMWPSGIPWQIMQAQVATRARYKHILTQLLAEDLTTESNIHQCRKTFRQEHLFPEITLFDINQPFPVNWEATVALIIVGRGGEMRTAYLRSGFSNAGPAGKRAFPFKGRAILRFEPSSLDVQLGQRVLLLRVLRLLDPIADRRSEGRTVMPVEGNLVKIKDMRKDPAIETPWAFDIDRSNSGLARALRLLWPEEDAGKGREIDGEHRSVG
ncbi:hypothetical protein B0H14DRAFT_1064968 [Mycena olivaceomarginata]|nr:hypothetical protein B0H14DRAFT_1064968 [Mycena olivaceomarginata]